MRKPMQQADMADTYVSRDFWPWKLKRTRLYVLGNQNRHALAPRYSHQFALFAKTLVVKTGFGDRLVS